jgi:hypothetical protein
MINTTNDQHPALDRITRITTATDAISNVGVRSYQYSKTDQQIAFRRA